MRRLARWCFGLLALPATAVLSAPIQEISIQKLVTGVNTARQGAIWFDLVLDQDQKVDAESLTAYVERSGIVADLRDAASEEMEVVAALEVSANDNLISFAAQDPGADVARRIFKGEMSVYIDLSGDLPLILQDGTRARLTPAQVQKLSAQISIGEAELDALEHVATGQQRAYENRLDLAREVGEADSLTAEYALSYQLSQPIPALLPLPLIAESRGRLGTDPDNPLNRLEFALVLAIPGVHRFGRSPVFGSAYFSAGVLGNQTLDSTAALIEVGGNLLLPNLVDLTGGANRLRLKPVVGASFGYRRQFQDQQLFEERDSWEAGYESAYIIPILNKYTLALESEGSYNPRARGEEFFHTTSIALYYDLPAEELEVLAKWDIGRNRFSVEQDSRVMLGIIADFLPF
jgi:hypothetical protein